MRSWTTDLSNNDIYHLSLLYCTPSINRQLTLWLDEHICNVGGSLSHGSWVVSTYVHSLTARSGYSNAMSKMAPSILSPVVFLHFIFAMVPSHIQCAALLLLRPLDETSSSVTDLNCELSRPPPSRSMCLCARASRVAAWRGESWELAITYPFQKYHRRSQKSVRQVRPDIHSNLIYFFQ